jgi:hypothetical protein
MKPTEYEHCDEPFSAWCLAREALLRELEEKGYHLIKEGEVPEWMKVTGSIIHCPSECNDGPCGHPPLPDAWLYRNTKEES